MNTVILDPTDPSKAVIGSFSEPSFGSYVEGGVLGNIHPASQCAGEHCVIHNPSDHSMRQFDLHWRDDRGIFERTCPHGVGHPDPDQFEYWRETGQEYQASHGCDGCCQS